MIPAKYGGVLLWGLALLPACGRTERAQNKTSAGEAAAPEESLATTTTAGVEVWFTLSRPARSTDGQSCVERGLEIRRDGRRFPVPLLYTGEAPTLLNDSTIRAMLWTHCRPVTPYRVDLRTGRPVREAEARRRP
jgi:hypothetical protein